MSTETLMRVGLRFSRSQARILRNLVAQLRADPPRGDFDISLFDKAAEAAENGEPLHVLCSDRDEAERMAAGFVLWGVKRPSMELLRGVGGDPDPH